MKPKIRPVFERDFLIALELFPKLRYELNKKRRHWIITGDLDICDKAGVYWGTFEIRMFIPQNYPHCVPVVQEVSMVIPRNTDWHIDEQGFCCVDINHKLVHNARKGINISDFMVQKVYSFFANQLYKLEHGEYSGEEYQHNFAGVVQFYHEDLGLDKFKAMALLEAVLSNKIGRNDLCPCRSEDKLKCCHLSVFNFLKGMERDQLKRDLKSFNFWKT